MPHRFQVQSDFQPQDSTELAISRGEIVTSNRVPRDGWLDVVNSAGQHGFVPLSYLKQYTTTNATSTTGMEIPVMGTVVVSDNANPPLSSGTPLKTTTTTSGAAVRADTSATILSSTTTNGGCRISSTGEELIREATSSLSARGTVGDMFLDGTLRISSHDLEQSMKTFPSREKPQLICPDHSVYCGIIERIYNGNGQPVAPATWQRQCCRKKQCRGVGTSDGMVLLSCPVVTCSHRICLKCAGIPLESLVAPKSCYLDGSKPPNNVVEHFFFQKMSFFRDVASHPSGRAMALVKGYLRPPSSRFDSRTGPAYTVCLLHTITSSKGKRFPKVSTFEFGVDRLDGNAYIQRVGWEGDDFIFYDGDGPVLGLLNLRGGFPSTCEETTMPQLLIDEEVTGVQYLSRRVSRLENAMSERNSIIDDLLQRVKKLEGVQHE